MKDKVVVGSIKQHKIVNIKFPVNVHNSFKAHCSSRGLTMQEYVVAMVERELSYSRLKKEVKDNE